MKVLVTGGAGFIGSNVVRLLLGEPGIQVINLDKLTYAGNVESLQDISHGDRYRFVHGDICNQSLVDEIFDREQPDAVMHLAAESHVDRSIDSPDAFIQTNLVGTYTLLEASRKYVASNLIDDACAFRFLHISTDEVFGDLSATDPAFTESTPYNPHSPYSASKAGSDHLVRAWRDTYGLATIVTNCSNNYGPYQYPEKLIPVAILNSLFGRPIPVYGQGQNVRDWLFVEDHARALLRVLTAGKPGQTYNIGGNSERTNLQIVETICDVLDELLPAKHNERLIGTGLNSYRDGIQFVEDRPGHDFRYAMDATKIRQELAWEPSESFDSGIRKTVQWYLNNESWWTSVLDHQVEISRLGLSPVHEGGKA